MPSIKNTAAYNRHITRSLPDLYVKSGRLHFFTYNEIYINVVETRLLAYINRRRHIPAQATHRLAQQSQFNTLWTIARGSLRPLCALCEIPKSEA